MQSIMFIHCFLLGVQIINLIRPGGGGRVSEIARADF